MLLVDKYASPEMTSVMPDSPYWHGTHWGNSALTPLVCNPSFLGPSLKTVLCAILHAVLDNTGKLYNAVETVYNVVILFFQPRSG